MRIAVVSIGGIRVTFEEDSDCKGCYRGSIDNVNVVFIIENGKCYQDMSDGLQVPVGILRKLYAV